MSREHSMRSSVPGHAHPVWRIQGICRVLSTRELVHSTHQWSRAAGSRPGTRVLTSRDRYHDVDSRDHGLHGCTQSRGHGPATCSPGCRWCSPRTSTCTPSMPHIGHMGCTGGEGVLHRAALNGQSCWVTSWDTCPDIPGSISRR
jgi:hypothetical protein